MQTNACFSVTVLRTCKIPAPAGNWTQSIHPVASHLTGWSTTTFLARGFQLLNLSIFCNFLLELIILTLSTRWYQVSQVNEYAAYVYVSYENRTHVYYLLPHTLPMSVAGRSNTWVCWRTLPGIAGTNSAGGMDVCLFWVVCCHVDIPDTGGYPVQEILPSLCVCLNVIRCRNNPLWVRRHRSV